MLQGHVRSQLWPENVRLGLRSFYYTVLCIDGFSFQFQFKELMWCYNDHIATMLLQHLQIVGVIARSVLAQINHSNPFCLCLLLICLLLLELDFRILFFSFVLHTLGLIHKTGAEWISV